MQRFIAGLNGFNHAFMHEQRNSRKIKPLYKLLTLFARAVTMSLQIIYTVEVNLLSEVSHSLFSDWRSVNN